MSAYEDAIDDWLLDWDCYEFECWAQDQICLNTPCDHPFCPEDQELDLWEGWNDPQS